MNSATLNIRTPEGIVFAQTLASPLDRFFARLPALYLVVVVAAPTPVAVDVRRLTSFRRERQSSGKNLKRRASAPGPRP